MAAIKRAAIPTAHDIHGVADRAEVAIQVRAVSRDLDRALRLGRYTIGRYIVRSKGRVLYTYTIKLNYHDHLPRFAAELYAASKLAKREGGRIHIVRQS
jgi:hypothetical protein